MRKLNNYISLGLLFNGISLVSTRFDLLPDFVEGICVGLGITFILIGMISSRYDITKLRNKKLAFIKNALGK